MLASPTSRWSAGAVLLTLLILAASWFLLISPRRDDASALRDQVTSAQGEASSLQTQIAQLKAQFADLPKKKAELAAIKEQLPATGEMPALVRSLQEYAAASGVSLESLTPGSPAIYSPDGAAATGTTAAAGSVIQIPLNITVTGDYFEDALFVKSLQTKLKRVLLITGVSADTLDTSAAVTGDPSATPAPAATATPGTAGTAGTAGTTVSTQTGTSLQLTSSVFVLADDTTTLQDVADQAKAATARTTTGKTSAPAATGNAS